jgi:putative nucleotidyltransferase with HDIG domain
MPDIKELRSLARDLTVLYVEDEPELRASVANYLTKIFSKVETAEDGQMGLKKYQEGVYDIVITDIKMPFMTGLQMAGEIKTIDEDQEIIIMSAYTEPDYFMDSIRLGINGYIIKPVNFDQINFTLFRSVRKLKRFRENIDYKEHLEEMVESRTKELLAMEKEKIANFENTLLAFVEMIEDRDTYTGGHSQRVASYSRMIAEEMGHTKEECEFLYRAGVLHDIGKIATPDTILLKPGRLNELEYKLIKEHVNVGYALLSKIPMYRDIAEVIVHHHERHDGKGYPQGIKGHEIPPLSRIMIVADAFDAMTTNRIYKGRKIVDEAIHELQALSGIQFEPAVVDAAVKVFTQISEIESTSQVPITDIEKERFSYFYRDQVTTAYNVDYLNFILNRNNFEHEFHHINVFFVHHFNRYNQQHGWSAGDALLHSIVEMLESLYPQALIFRVHGDDFVLISSEPIAVNLHTLQHSPLIRSHGLSLSHQYFAIDDESLHNLHQLEKRFADCEDKEGQP